MNDPIMVTCPACNAQPGEQCTQATSTGRAVLRRTHLARNAEARDE